MSRQADAGNPCAPAHCNAHNNATNRRHPSQQEPDRFATAQAGDVVGLECPDLATPVFFLHVLTRAPRAAKVGMAPATCARSGRKVCLAAVRVPYTCACVWVARCSAALRLGNAPHAWASGGGLVLPRTRAGTCQKCRSSSTS